MLEKLAKVGDPEIAPGGFDGQRMGKAPLAEPEVMAVRLPVGGDADDLTRARVGIPEAVDERRARLQKSLEGDRMGNGAVIEKDREESAGAVTDAVKL